MKWKVLLGLCLILIPSAFALFSTDIADSCIVCQGGSSGNGSSYWTQSGSFLYPQTLSWNVGIGTNTPVTRLDVNGNITADNCIILGTNNMICSENGVMEYYS